MEITCWVEKFYNNVSSDGRFKTKYKNTSLDVLLEYWKAYIKTGVQYENKIKHRRNKIVSRFKNSKPYLFQHSPTHWFVKIFVGLRPFVPYFNSSYCFLFAPDSFTRGSAVFERFNNLINICTYYDTHGHVYIKSIKRKTRKYIVHCI